MTHPLFNKLRRLVAVHCSDAGLDKMVELVNELETVAMMPNGERFFHEKRGTTYDVYGVGHANSAREFDVITPGFHRGVETRLKGKKILFDRDKVVIYRDVQSGAFSIRAKGEFLDGRFTLLPRLPGQPLPDPARALVERIDDGSASPITNGQPPRLATVETGTQRVKYSGPTVRLRGQEGSVVSCIGGNLMVDWDDKRSMEGLGSINTFNVTEIGDR